MVHHVPVGLKGLPADVEKGVNNHDPAIPLIIWIQGSIKIKSDGAMFNFFNLMPDPEGSKIRVGVAHKFFIAIQNNHAA